MVYHSILNRAPYAIQDPEAYPTIHNSLDLLTPNSQHLPPPPPSPLATTSLLCVSLFPFCRQVYLCHILDSTRKWQRAIHFTVNLPKPHDTFAHLNIQTAAHRVTWCWSSLVCGSDALRGCWAGWHFLPLHQMVPCHPASFVGCYGIEDKYNLIWSGVSERLPGPRLISVMYTSTAWNS